MSKNKYRCVVMSALISAIVTVIILLLVSVLPWLSFEGSPKISHAADTNPPNPAYTEIGEETSFITEANKKTDIIINGLVLSYEDYQRNQVWVWVEKPGGRDDVCGLTGYDTIQKVGVFWDGRTIYQVHGEDEDPGTPCDGGDHIIFKSDEDFKEFKGEQ